nr:hypothetical protein [Actibacterium sp. 188UL27-1]
MLISWAPVAQIGGPLLTAWLQILADHDMALLVLHPFDQDQKLGPGSDRFEQRLQRACIAAGVPRDRILVFPPLTDAEALGVLSLGDVYLDSFPLSDPATVAALQAGLPVVAMAGQTARGHLGAGWLADHGLDALIAGSVDDYRRIAGDLIATAERRAALRQTLNDVRARPEDRDGLVDHLMNQGAGPAVAPRYLFHHMPKTGGTTVRKMFGTWFHMVGDYRAPWATVLPLRMDLDQIAPHQMLCGHFASDLMPLNQKYPETLDPQRWRRVTFVRSPLETALSIHAFENKRRVLFDPDFEVQELGPFLRNSMGPFLQHFECGVDDWQAALDRYWFIGTLERLPECMAYLGRHFGKAPPAFVPHENQTTRLEQPDPEDIAAFKRRNAVEFEMYDEICARLDRRLG